jgi:hypothetical protein
MLRVSPVVAIARTTRPGAARTGARASRAAAAVVSGHARRASLPLSRPGTAPVSLQGKVSRKRSSRISHAVREVTTCRYGGYDPTDSMGETTAPERIFSTLPYLLPVLESLRYGARTHARPRRCRWAETPRARPS